MTNLEHIRVRDAMHQGIVTCTGDTPLTDIAALMASHRLHAVAVTDTEGGRPLGVVSALDVMGAISSGAELTAAQVAGTEPLAISSDERLQRAAQMMHEHAVSHLVVLEAASGKPVGVLSTLDLAAVYAESAKAAA